jgi:hypothetical protein
VTIHLLRYNGESASFTDNDFVLLHVLKDAIEVFPYAAYLHRADLYCCEENI